MTTKTPAQLATEILQYMTIIAADETPDANDSAYVIDKYNAKFAELCAPPDEIAYWERDIIPVEIFLTLRDLVANECMAAFGKPMNAGDKESSDQIIMRRLRRHTHMKSSGHQTQADYF